jgi:hypothetical protein
VWLCLRIWLLERAFHFNFLTNNLLVLETLLLSLVWGGPGTQHHMGNRHHLGNEAT